MSQSARRDPEADRLAARRMDLQMESFRNDEEAERLVREEQNPEPVIEAVTLARWTETYFENNKAENCP